ncbi:MAG: hypothetical protein QG675_260 [Patescibacteria group bacterium]|jgi:uncharacterized repeat protein (TIGR01451 family)|nr:hypothetical protein [Patescibacteria group bacterium]
MKLTTKIGLGALAALIAVIVPVMAFAGWYPDRPTKKWDGPLTTGFDQVTFNSFYNTPMYGNETEFFDGKQTGQGPFYDNINVTVGQEITLRTYVHNGADPSLNSAENNYRGIARNTKVKVGLPAGFGTKMNAVSQVSADNAQPGSVFDTVDFTSANGTPFKVSYVPGSAYASTHSVTQMPLSDNIVTSGALIGETAPDGNVPGCFQYASYVVIKVKVEAVPLKVQKTVAFPKQPFVEQVDAKAGDRLYFKVDFKNEGTDKMNNVVITDKLPSQFEVLPGTTKLYNATYPDGHLIPDGALFTAGGVGVGNYGAGINGYILYQVKVKDNTQGLLTNVACARSTEVPYDTCDDAKVKTPEPPKPQECLPGIPVGDPRCTTTPPPVTPPTTETSVPAGTLPDTGLESGLSAMLGMTGISAGVHAYRKSKKAAKDVVTSKNRK